MKSIGKIMILVPVLFLATQGFGLTQADVNAEVDKFIAQLKAAEIAAKDSKTMFNTKTDHIKKAENSTDPVMQKYFMTMYQKAKVIMDDANDRTLTVVADLLKGAQALKK
ncbi:MAG: hypothetical protein NTX86_02040 [Candidatus Dependentiae bacterium]|nr:hypothetical protein [Candidatus Dependentiae bacterium]